MHLQPECDSHGLVTPCGTPQPPGGSPGPLYWPPQGAVHQEYRQVQGHYVAQHQELHAEVIVYQTCVLQFTVSGVFATDVNCAVMRR